MRFRLTANLILNSAAVVIATAGSAAGCPMCKASLANAENAAEVATPINAAILILLIPTLAIIGGLVKLVLSYRHYQNDEPVKDSSDSNNSYVNLGTSDSERNTQ